MNPRPKLLAATDTRNLAAIALACQLESGGRHFGVNLDDLWRASGAIPGESPEEWLKLASPLLQAAVGYRRAVESRACPKRTFEARPATWHVTKQLHATIGATLDPAEAETFEVGDTLTCETIAGVYVAFIDQSAERRPFTDAGKAQRRAFLKRVDGFPPFHAPDPIPVAEPEEEPAELVA